LGEADDHLPGWSADIEGLHRLPKPFKPRSLIALVTAIASQQPHQAETPRVAETG